MGKIINLRPCTKQMECNGNCWINIAATFGVWKIISKFCGGTKEEKDMLEGMFYQEIDRSKLFDKYDFTDKEKEILEGGWY